MQRAKIMIAGIGGASLGTEICKCLRLAGRYEVFGCDISPTAYGLYDPEFAATYRIDATDYVASVISACHVAGARWIVPGGEQPMTLLSAASERLAEAGIRLVANDSAIVRLLSDKRTTFAKLEATGIAVPRTCVATQAADVEQVGVPCIVKPATGSGGSASVFFALTCDEALIYADFIRRSGGNPIVQEYVDVTEGEFTIGVLSLPDGRVVGSIALRRSLDAKLSVAYRGRGGVISSGYSQGHIGDYPYLRRQAEHIAQAIGSRGPVNIQGRLRNGNLLPFEINPRFSASAYLRAMAGFNEVDLFLRHLLWQEAPPVPSIKTGWYLRSLAETYVQEAQLK